MAVLKPGRLADYEAFLAPLQRAFLGSNQKRSNGNFSSGASGINASDAHTMEWRPSMGQPATGQQVSSGMASAYAAAANQAATSLSKGTGATADWTANDWTARLNANGQAAPKTTDNGTGIGSTSGTTNSGIPPGTTTPTTGTTSGTTGGGTTSGGMGELTFSGDYAADAQKLITMLQKISSTPFQYNAATDPSYLAAKQSLETQAASAKDQTYADMADRGILNSSVTTDHLGKIQQQTVQSLAQVVPGLEANAFGRYQQNISNQSNVIQSALGQLNFQQGFEADQRWREADVTGTYESPEYKKLFDSVIGAKQGYAGTTDPAERNKFADQGKGARAALAAITGRTQAEIDQMLGSNVGIDAAKANFGMGGQQTVAEKSRIEAGGRYKDETTYNHEQDKKTWDFKNKDYDETIRHNKAMEAKGSGGSSGHVPTFNEILKGSTNQFANQMLYEVNKDPNDKRPFEEKAREWLSVNAGLLAGGSVSPGDVFNEAKGIYAGSDKADPNAPPTGAKLTEVVISAAQKDPAWQDADTPEKKQEILNYYTKLYSPNSGGGGGGGGGSWVDGLYNFFKPFIPPKNAGKGGSPTTKKTTSGGGGSAKHNVR